MRSSVDTGSSEHRPKSEVAEQGQAGGSKGREGHWKKGAGVQMGDGKHSRLSWNRDFESTAESRPGPGRRLDSSPRGLHRPSAERRRAAAGEAAAAQRGPEGGGGGARRRA